MTIVDACTVTFRSQGLNDVAFFWELLFFLFFLFLLFFLFFWECWVNSHIKWIAVNAGDTIASLYSESDKAIFTKRSTPRILDDPIFLAFV